MDKESACNAGDTGRRGFIPGSGRFPGGGHGNPLHGESPWMEDPGGLQSIGHKESDTTELTQRACMQAAV